MVLVRYSALARGALMLLFPGAVAMRSALTRIKPDASPIDLLRLPLGFEAFPDFIGMGDVCEAEQRFAEA